MLETLLLHHLARVTSLLLRGEIVAYPTGTSYALGVNALDAESLKRLDVLKGRLPEKTYTVLLPVSEPTRFVDWSPEEARAFSLLRDRPLTLLVPARESLASLARDGCVGIRTPDHPFTRELASLLPFPITATSANRSGEMPAYSLAELETLAADRTLYAVNGGTLPRRLPSTVAALVEGTWRIARPGEVTITDLERALT